MCVLSVSVPGLEEGHIEGGHTPAYGGPHLFVESTAAWSHDPHSQPHA